MLWVSPSQRLPEGTARSNSAFVAGMLRHTCCGRADSGAMAPTSSWCTHALLVLVLVTGPALE